MCMLYNSCQRLAHGQPSRSTGLRPLVLCAWQRPQEALAEGGVDFLLLGLEVSEM